MFLNVGVVYSIRVFDEGPTSFKEATSPFMKFARRTLRNRVDRTRQWLIGITSFLIVLVAVPGLHWALTATLGLCAITLNMLLGFYPAELQAERKELQRQAGEELEKVKSRAKDERELLEKRAEEIQQSIRDELGAGIDLLGHFSDILASSIRQLEVAVKWLSEDQLIKAKEAVTLSEQRALHLFARAMAQIIASEESEIFANLMVPVQEEDETYLKVVRYGGNIHDSPFNRHERMVPINDQIPGAPKAFTSCMTQYVEDISDPKYKPHFDEWLSRETERTKFRSVISIPLYTAQSDPISVIGVVNIDAKSINAFPKDVQEEFEALSLPWAYTLSCTVTCYKLIHEKLKQV